MGQWVVSYELATFMGQISVEISAKTTESNHEFEDTWFYSPSVSPETIHDDVDNYVDKLFGILETELEETEEDDGE